MLKMNTSAPRFFNSVITVLLFCVNLSVFALPPAPPATTLETSQPEFNLKQANKAFDQLNLLLSVENLNIEHLEAAITTLNGLINDAKLCIGNNQKKLSGLDNLTKEAEPIKVMDKTDTTSGHARRDNKAGADLVYLNQEQQNLTDKIAQCRLFSIRAQEAINTYQSAIAKLKQQQVLKRGLPLLSLWEHLQKDPTQIDITLPSLTQVSAFSNNLLSSLAVILGFCVIVSALTIRYIKVQKLTQYTLRVRHFGMRDGILLFVCLAASCLSLYLVHELSTQNNDTALVTDILKIGCAYLWSLTLINLIFKSKVVSATFYWYSLDSRFFKSLLIFLLTYYTISQMGASLVATVTLSDLLWQLSQIIFLTAVVITTISFVYYFCHTHRHIQFIHAHRTFFQRSSFLLFLSCGILNMLGYHQMAIHLTYASIFTFAILFTVFLLGYAIQKIYLLCAYPSPVYRTILRSLGYRSDQTVIEFIIIKTTLQMIIVGFGIYLMGQTWGYGAYFINTAYSQLLNGIHFASFTFYPTRIVTGLLVFCVLYLFFRSIATKFSRHSQFEEEEETQVAVASILIYIGFTCALVTALLISGIDFTGLAIVAGALSVGIGLGLQSIVNNFVSGIILLIEKPIKPGDRIKLDNLEGIVKKIRIRSTQITTSVHEDVIIPNSELITRAVTNFMYTDRYLSISCEVGVTYDSDPVLVKKLLLQAISEHDEIIKSPRAKASVLLDKFGDSAIVFQLWFLIKDGNKKAAVRSDVNFTIDRLFREHHIKIAHPQRDINVKLSEIPTKLIDN